MKTNYNYLMLTVVFLLAFSVKAQTIVSKTYDDGDIPTNYNGFDETCNGPLTTLSFTLPATGGPWVVTGFDVEYDMTTDNSAWMSEQRSYVYFQTGDVSEPEYQGSGSGGTYHYDRANVDIANGSYADETELVFEMRAWRTWTTIGEDDCGTYNNKVDDGTWKITLHYISEQACFPQVDIEESNVTHLQADISWTDTGADYNPATSWNIEYGPVGFTQGAGTTVNTTTNPYTITGLSESTEYDVYVQADCGAGDVSEWTGPYTFQSGADCTGYNLEITSTTDDTITCKGTGNLSAVAGGEGSEIYWYDAASGGSIVGVGAEFKTPFLETGASYWASEVLLDGNGVSVGQGASTWAYGYSSSGSGQGIVFTATEEFTLVSVEVFSAASGGGEFQINLLDDDNSGQQIATTTVTLPSGSTDSPTSVIVPLNFEITPGNYRLVAGGSVPSMMYEYYSSGGYPFSLGGAGEITAGATSYGTSDYSYYYFYNWTIDEGGLECQSPLVEATASITTDGDVDIAALPYSVTDDTSNYGDTFSGTSGSGCGSDANYLNGDDVIYTYTAAEDNVLQITLSDLTDFYGGVFVYDSCAEIGEVCSAGAVAGPSDDDFGITEFHVTAGETYYIVISSWLTPSIGYTLDIKGFDCATFEAPLGNADQAFAPGDDLTEVEVETTMSNTTIVWYSDAAGTTEIPETTVLVDGTIYYAGQKFVDCVGALLPITVHKVACETLEIISTTGDEVACRGEMTLVAESSGTGSEIYWYDAATDGNMLGIGDNFDTPNLTLTTSYWASEVYIDGYEVSSGYGFETWSYAYSNSPYNDQGLAFTATESFTLVSVDVYSGYYNLSLSGGDLEVKLMNAATGDQIGASYFTTLPQASESDPELVTLMLNFVIPGPGEYYLVAAGGAPGMKYEYAYPNAGYPYPLSDVGQITSYISGTYEDYSSYYYFYNWTIGKGEVICESPRVEVEAVVTPEGDINIDELPYATTNNTTLFGNDFSGVPGSGCGASGNYLAGNDVVYLYTPAEDDVLNIKFEDLTSNGTAGLFIYNSCGAIGVECLAGVVEDESASLEIQDLYVTGGMNYFFVISTSNGDPVGYDFEINGFNCDTAPAPFGEAEQPYTSGDLVSDLQIEGNSYNEGFIWYSDAEGTTVIPDTTPLAEGVTYYVSQTVLGCESGLLAITVHEFDCTVLSVASTTDGYICNVGTTTLSAESVSGNKIYWYDAPTDGNLVGIGEEFETPVLSTNTSYYASEVFVNGEVNSSGYGMTTQDYGYSSSPYYDQGLVFTAEYDFTLVSVDIYAASTGDVEILLIDADSGDALASTSVSLPGGNNTNPELITVPLDFEVPEAGEYYLIAGGVSNYNVSMMYEYYYPDAGYPFNIGTGGTIGQITSSFSNGSTYAYNYYFFYNWTVKVGEVQCSSERVEAMAIINTEPTAAPNAEPEQALCEGQTLADIAFEGDAEIVWYTAAAEGDFLPSSTLAVDGATYYAAQIVEACESADRSAITITVDPISELPEGATNQSFIMGQTIADFEVEGTNLVWYSDEEGTTVIPTSTELVSQEKYYVSQTVAGSCESELLSVTAHEIMNVDGATMADMYYYPNPVKHVLKVGNSSAIDAIEIYNMLGQRVIVEKPHALQTTIDVSGLQTGTYLMRVIVISEGKAGMVKIIKE